MNEEAERVGITRQHPANDIGQLNGRHFSDQLKRALQLSYFASGPKIFRRRVARKMRTLHSVRSNTPLTLPHRGGPMKNPALISPHALGY